ncbi:MAG: hypothetical protein IT222_11160 [Crocinitomix sp.]|nr:hypothetical protein [Crocinitomix sp.]
MKKYIFIGLGLAIVIGVSIGLYLFNEKVPTLEDTKPDFVISANDLFNEFEADETAALKKYENKVIEVTGKVLSVQSDPKQSTILLEAEMAMAGGVNCSFKYAQEKEIAEGSQVRIKGQCQGFLMDVVLNNCFLME